MKIGQLELWYLLAAGVRYLLESAFFAVGICVFLRYLKRNPREKK